MNHTLAITNKTWDFCYQRNMTYQKARLFSYGYLHSIPKKFKVKTNFQLYRFKKSICEQFFEKNETKKVFDIVGKKFQDVKSTSALAEYKKGITADYHAFTKYIRKMTTNYSNHTSQEVYDAFKKYHDIEHALGFSTWFLFTPFEDELVTALQKALKEKYSSQKSNEIIEKVSQPTEPLPLEDYHDALCKIRKATKDQKRKLLEKYAKKYIHKGMYDITYQQYSKEAISTNAKSISHIEAKAYSTRIQKKYSNRKKNFQKILQAEKKDPYVFALISLFNVYANYKEWKPYYREESSYKLRFLVEEMAKRISLSVEQTSFMTLDEMKNALIDKKVISSDILNKRINNSVLLSTKEKDIFIIDEKELEEIDKVLSHQESTTAQGICAYPGTVKGPAKIIISNKDFAKFNKGDILITGITRPDYVPIMNKAAAIITNEGGMLSHAAIIAREIKKPCIIGTKIATKIFKDGEMLEIDANAGTVKKI